MDSEVRYEFIKKSKWHRILECIHIYMYIYDHFINFKKTKNLNQLVTRVIKDCISSPSQHLKEVIFFFLF